MRVLVRNPVSGNRERSKQAAELARGRGFEVWESTARGETYGLAKRAAAEGAELVVACGGDGTLNEVVRGVDDAGSLPDTRLGVVPAGTGNNFADNVGVRGVEHAFEVIETTEPRSLDLGAVTLPAEPRGSLDGPTEERPFVNSCVGGLTAEASGKTTPAAKKRLGVLAYVMRTLAESRTFEGLTLEVRAGARGKRLWTGEAIMLLIGNGRRFPGERMKQANVEDGLLNVVIIERAPAIDYFARGAADRLLRRDAFHLTRLKVPRLDVTHDGDPVRFSLDGEMVERDCLVAGCRRGALRFHVGPDYDPNPEEWGRTTPPKSKRP